MADVFDQSYSVTKKERNSKNGHDSFLILLTGLSGAGKSVIANALDKELFKQNIKAYPLDGDNIRLGINNNLKFSEEDRLENLRRIAEISKLFIDAGVVTIAAFVSPFKKSRDMIKSIVGEENYVEVFVKTSLEECERRDAKGLYAKAREGEIKNFTGISSPYETPENPNIVIDTAETSVEEAVSEIMNYIAEKLALES